MALILLQEPVHSVQQILVRPVGIGANLAAQLLEPRLNGVELHRTVREKEYLSVEFLPVELDYFMIFYHLMVHDEANLVLYLIVPVLLLPTKSLVLLFLYF